MIQGDTFQPNNLYHISLLLAVKNRSQHYGWLQRSFWLRLYSKGHALNLPTLPEKVLRRGSAPTMDYCSSFELFRLFSVDEHHG
jgi:hypothetical protein